jgi:hypothetical protein
MAHHRPSTAGTSGSFAARHDTCLGRTCLQWGADGELCAPDLQLVLERLSRVDGCARGLAPAQPQQLRQAVKAP